MSENRPYAFIGTPEPSSGVKIVSLEELKTLMEKPHMKDAVERINRLEGKPRAFQVIFHESNSKKKSELTRVETHNQITAQELYARKVKRLQYEKSTDASTRLNVDIERVMSGR